MMTLPRATISPWVIPSRGTSLPSAPITNNSPEVINSTPCRALIAARSLIGRDVCSGRCSQTVMNGAVSVGLYTCVIVHASSFSCIVLVFAVGVAHGLVYVTLWGGSVRDCFGALPMDIEYFGAY